MWQLFTERARRLVFSAQEEAGRLGENYVSTEHLLLGLVRENDCVAARILDRMGISLGRIRDDIERQVTRGDGRLEQDMQLTPRAKRVIDLAYDEARQLSNNYIGTEHLLLGLIREGEGLAGRVLAELGVDLERTRQEVLLLQDNDSGTQAQVHENEYTRQFAAEYAKLSDAEKTALTGDGLAFHKLPEAIQKVVRRMSEQGVKNDTFVLDPNALVRVNITKVEGFTHYTLTTKAAFLANMLVKDE